MRKSKEQRHPWLEHRNAPEPSLVLRIDNYSTQPQTRGQFYPELDYTPDDFNNKAIWPDRESACKAAEWATKKFGHQYAVFTMIGIVEQDHPPLKITVI